VSEREDAEKPVKRDLKICAEENEKSLLVSMGEKYTFSGNFYLKS
jgi:hypothetical protein